MEAQKNFVVSSQRDCCVFYVKNSNRRSGFQKNKVVYLETQKKIYAAELHYSFEKAVVLVRLGCVVELQLFSCLFRVFLLHFSGTKFLVASVERELEEF